MVIYEDTEKPVEQSSKKVIFDENSYGLYGNQKENTIKQDSSMNIDEENPLKPQNVSDGKIRKRKIKSKKSNSSSTDSEENHQSSEISTEDLEELKTVYKKCKAVIKKIESKYGHLLDLDIEEPRYKHSRIQNVEENECRCTLNKKIVFDEDGKEVTIDSLPSNHICPQKLMLQPKIPPVENKSIQIEYASNDIVLSDDLQELAVILQNPELETTYRNQVIDKVRSIRLENSNDIRFNKHSLVEKLKSDPDTVLDFKGANLSVLSGYS